MSKQMVIGLVGIALLAVASTVIARQMLQIEGLQARVTVLEDRVADIGKLKLLPVGSGK
jgi:hypothetical protein